MTHFRRSIRVHPQRGSPNGWGNLQPVPWCAAGFWHDDAVDPGSRLDYHGGLAWPQDAASLLPVVLLAPQPGEFIVDCCAAPGSKSTQIGLALGDDGLLVCCDAVPARRRVIAESLARQGVLCGLVTPLPVAALARLHPAWADAVLVDAPCSGHAEMASARVRQLARLQGRLLTQAAQLLRPGGRLVYSTCTAERAEDEDVVAAFLEAHPGWQVESATLPGCGGDRAGLGGILLHPDHHGTEPFFAIRLRAPSDGRHGPWPEGRSPAASPLPASCGELKPALAWTSGRSLLVGSHQVATTALPSEARGLVLAREDNCDSWGAQWAISQGAAAWRLPRVEAQQLWSGADLSDPGDDHIFAATEDGLPLGLLQRRDGRIRLDLPSRLYRAVSG